MTATTEASAEETEMIVNAAVCAALTVIARTLPLNPDGRGDHFSGLHAAHAAFRKVYASHVWPKDRLPATKAWVATPTPDGNEDYREGYQDFTARIQCIVEGDAYVIANVLEEDLSDMPLERIAYGVAL